MPSSDAEDPQEENSIGGAIRENPGIAARAGVIAPLIGIVLLLVLGVTVNEWVGIAVGLGATLLALPITLWLLARRRGRHG